MTGGSKAATKSSNPTRIRKWVDTEPESQPAKKAAPAAPLAKDDAPEDSSDSESEFSEEQETSSAKKPAPTSPTDSHAADGNAAPGAPLAKADAPEEDSSESDTESSEEEESSSASGAKKPAPATPTGSHAAHGKAENSRKKGAVTKSGKKLFVRIFSPEDEIVLLEGLAKKYPKEPSEMDGFFESIKARFSVSVSKDQVRSKIKKLRLKYIGKRKKEASTNKRGSNKEEGEKKDDLESKAYELSDKIWGDEEMPKSTESKREFMKKLGAKELLEGSTEEWVFGRCHGGSTEEWVFGEGKELLDDETRGELEREWKLIRKEEARVLVKKLDLSCKHAKLVCDAMIL